MGSEKVIVRIMITKILIIVLIVFTSCQNYNLSGKKKIESFVLSLCDNNLTTKQIIKDHFTEVTSERYKKNADSMLTFVINSMKNRIDCNSISPKVFTYKEAKLKKLEGFYEIEGDTKDVYFWKMTSNELSPFKVSENGKIVSLITIRKGKKGYFLEFGKK